MGSFSSQDPAPPTPSPPRPRPAATLPDEFFRRNPHIGKPDVRPPNFEGQAGKCSYRSSAKEAVFEEEEEDEDVEREAHQCRNEPAAKQEDIEPKPKWRRLMCIKIKMRIVTMICYTAAKI